MTNKLTNEDKIELSKFFLQYKNDNSITTQKIADKFGVDRTTIGNYFKKKFGDNYINISRFKSRYLREKLKLETKLKISLALKGKPKPTRSVQHRLNLSKAMSKPYVERFGKEKAEIIAKKIGSSNFGKKRKFKNKELWKINLSNSLKGREVWNKGKKGLQKAWNKKGLPNNEIIDMYLNKDMSSVKIASRFDVDRDVILRILKENNIKLKYSVGFMKGKKLIEILGKEKAELKIQKLSEKLKGRKYTWGDKISKSLRKYYQECRIKNYKIYRIGLARTPEQRLKLSLAHKQYLKNHPEELDRLRKIQYPGKITKVEQKMLNFLRERFKEDEDFYFDKLDSSGKTFYRPDFQFPRDNIIIEVDGYYKHFTKEGHAKDKIREYYLRKAGWRVYRFNFYDIDREYKFKIVKDKLMNILGDGNVSSRY